MDLSAKIREMAEAKLAPGQFIVDVLVSSHKGPRKVSVIMDGDQGVSIDDCAEISRYLSKQLDETALIQDNYMLEVSTPGVDQPLKLKRQYKKHIGRNLKLKLQNGLVEGKLTEVHENTIVLIQEVGSGKKKELKTTEIPFSDIEKALVQVSFK